MYENNVAANFFKHRISNGLHTHSYAQYTFNTQRCVIRAGFTTPGLS